MNKDFVLDYAGYILLKGFGPLVRALPRGIAYQSAAILGMAAYYLDRKHRSVVYTNLKTAFSGRWTPAETRRQVKKWYRCFSQIFLEMFFIPVIDKDYIRKYFEFSGFEHIGEAFKRGNGVIFMGVHAGSWELANVVCSNLGFPFTVLIKNQRLPRLNRLLNSYRTDQNTRVIGKGFQLREVVGVLKCNTSLGITVDQGGREGTRVEFFGKDASMASGAVRLGLRFGAALIPVFLTRKEGPYKKIIVNPPLGLEKTGDPEKDIRVNLQRLISVFEKYIAVCPSEYLWSYKVWKYSNTRNILVLNDGKAGHLRQSEALAATVQEYLKGDGITSSCTTVEVNFRKRKWKRVTMALCSRFAGKYSCQGCLRCAQSSLSKETYEALIRLKPDIVISCGSALAPVNRVFSKENSGFSMVIMRPSFFRLADFNLVVAPRHDRLAPRKNVIVTDGALNVIDESSVRAQACLLDAQVRISRQPVIGLLIGGDAKDFRLSGTMAAEVVREIKKAVETLNGELLVTTSRRTSPAVEELVKRELAGYQRCRFLVIANEKNFPWAIGGIAGRSDILVISPESISMISEAASSGKHTVVFNAPGLGRRHRRFLENLREKEYIALSDPAAIGGTLTGLWRNKPPVNVLNDRAVVREALQRIL
ncbi:MAG: ELM1/GtrOC1 family putative glycosyltransferase [Candidatus Omnitrophota bacterium]|jgi:KDO2-lipid IV(A) lauroyltransferase